MMEIDESWEKPPNALQRTGKQRHKFHVVVITISLLVQVITILVLGDVTIIGYAISAQIVGIILMILPFYFNWRLF